MKCWNKKHKLKHYTKSRWEKSICWGYYLRCRNMKDKTTKLKFGYIILVKNFVF